MSIKVVDPSMDRHCIVLAVQTILKSSGIDLYWYQNSKDGSLYIANNGWQVCLNDETITIWEYNWYNEITGNEHKFELSDPNCFKYAVQCLLEMPQNDLKR